MNPFDYERATEARGAVAAVAARPDAQFLGGGTNLVDHMKLGVARPGMLVDVTRLPFDSVEVRPEGGVRVGGMMRNGELAADPLIRERYPVLAQALLAGASGQLRNLATTGGNLLQRTRCPYFQDLTTPCNKREPGSGCSALHGWNRDHAILGGSSECVAVHPSDLAVALTALDAVVRLQSPGHDRGLPVHSLYRLPADDPSQDTVLEHGELITAVDLPEASPNTRSAYRKVRDRASYAFALSSVAAVVDAADGVVQSARLALGGVATVPWRASRAEEVLRGAPATEETFRAAADAELEAAEPLRHNEFKVALTRNTIVAVLRDLVAEEGSG